MFLNLRAYIERGGGTSTTLSLRALRPGAGSLQEELGAYIEET